jgi:hypothetical protein
VEGGLARNTKVHSEPLFWTDLIQSRTWSRYSVTLAELRVNGST